MHRKQYAIEHYQQQWHDDSGGQWGSPTTAAGEYENDPPQDRQAASNREKQFGGHAYTSRFYRGESAVAPRPGADGGCDREEAREKQPGCQREKSRSVRLDDGLPAERLPGEN